MAQQKYNYYLLLCVSDEMGTWKYGESDHLRGHPDQETGIITKSLHNEPSVEIDRCIPLEMAMLGETCSGPAGSGGGGMAKPTGTHVTFAMNTVNLGGVARAFMGNDEVPHQLINWAIFEIKDVDANNKACEPHHAWTNMAERGRIESMDVAITSGICSLVLGGAVMGYANHDGVAGAKGEMFEVGGEEAGSTTA